ncbi:Intraflagellar transport protein 88 [Sparganum proliferum]
MAQRLASTQFGRLKTGLFGGDRPLATGETPASSAGNRPMTSVRAAGFSSNLRRTSAIGLGRYSLDLSNQTGRPDGAAVDVVVPPLEQNFEENQEAQIKEMEKKVTALFEESCLAAADGDYGLALERAKEAGRKERVLVRQREQLGIADQINLDLTYSVLFNLANRYADSGMHQEALNTYQAIVRNKMFTHAGRLKVNMGNIYFTQKNYGKAIKMYRMGLDQVPNTHKSMRIKIMQNIGIAFVKLRQYNDAITAFEHIMQEEPDVKTAFNLILCYFKTGDKGKMKYTFQRLLRVNLNLDDEERYLSHNDDKQYENILEVIKNDELRQYEKNRKAHAENVLKIVAKIIAPAIEPNFNLGYTWCIEQTKTSTYNDLANDLEIDKALMYLKQRDFHQAIETLKSFENKDTRIACTAATNLSFLYFLEGDLAQADRYADQALAADRYSPSALVNKGNVLFKQKLYERARDCYREALQDDPTCVEALYNFGLTAKQLDRLDEALDAFYKIHAILRNNVLVMYQMMDIYEKMEDTAQAQDWFLQIHGIISSDPFLLQRCGDNFERAGDKSQAFSYYYDSFKYYPCNFDVIEWLGAYYIESQFCEKSITYFERAALMQPNQIKWQLMIASCYRKSGNYQQALEVYKKIHKQFPDSIECLQFLVRLSKDMGLPETQEYINRLKKAEKSKEAREQRQLSASNRQPIAVGVVGQLSDSKENLASTESGGNRENSASARLYNGQLSRRGLSSRGGVSGMPVREPSGGRDDPTSTVSSLPISGMPSQDPTYRDPLGPSTERPRTAATRKKRAQDEFADEELDVSMLPD